MSSRPSTERTVVLKEFKGRIDVVENVVKFKTGERIGQIYKRPETQHSSGMTPGKWETEK
jgi:hypothetical protein